ncbi:efflux transporter outer membrane subunit [soil metagenome]
MRKAAIVVAVVLLGGPAAAQERVTHTIAFEDAIERAVTSHPTVERASAGILRAEAILQQVTALSRPALDATLTTRTIGPVQEFAGAAINPRTQLTAGVNLAVPLLTPVRWAQRAQARDQVLVAQRGADDVRRAIAVAAAEAYLAVIAQRRVLELNARARENAQAHYDYAHRRFEGGLGSRLNALRAQQELSSVEAQVEEARLGVQRAQEALGVLVAADEPVDAATEPVFDLPASVEPGGMAPDRPDVRLVLARRAAAERVVADAWRDRLPEVTAVVAPQLLQPTGLFAPARSWSAAVLFSVPIFDGGSRSGLARERQALLTSIRAEQADLERQARSEIRGAHDAVHATERALVSARTAAGQAGEVLSITDLAFRTGATTNIEVIDAQRRARDADTAAVIAEDAVRRARLELLVALGRFPR